VYLGEEIGGHQWARDGEMDKVCENLALVPISP